MLLISLAPVAGRYWHKLSIIYGTGLVSGMVSGKGKARQVGSLFSLMHGGNKINSGLGTMHTWKCGTRFIDVLAMVTQCPSL